MLRVARLLLLCLFATSLAVTAGAHALEPYGAADLCCESPHADGAVDKAPAGGDPSVPHPHGTCHGHGVTAQVASATLAPRPLARMLPRTYGTTCLSDAGIDPALEPPRA